MAQKSFIFTHFIELCLYWRPSETKEESFQVAFLFYAVILLLFCSAFFVFSCNRFVCFVQLLCSLNRVLLFVINVHYFLLVFPCLHAVRFIFMWLTSCLFAIFVFPLWSNGDGTAVVIHVVWQPSYALCDERGTRSMATVVHRPLCGN